MVYDIYLRLTSFDFSVRTLGNVYGLDLENSKYMEKHVARDLCISYFSTILFERIFYYDKCLTETQT